MTETHKVTILSDPLSELPLFVGSPVLFSVAPQQQPLEAKKCGHAALQVLPEL